MQNVNKTNKDFKFGSCLTFDLNGTFCADIPTFTSVLGSIFNSDVCYDKLAHVLIDGCSNSFIIRDDLFAILEPLNRFVEFVKLTFQDQLFFFLDLLVLQWLLEFGFDFWKCVCTCYLDCQITPFAKFYPYIIKRLAKMSCYPFGSSIRKELKYVKVFYLQLPETKAS